jgi:hypothetical protein
MEPTSPNMELYHRSFDLSLRPLSRVNVDSIFINHKYKPDEVQTSILAASAPRLDSGLAPVMGQDYWSGRSTLDYEHRHHLFLCCYNLRDTPSRIRADTPGLKR